MLGVVSSIFLIPFPLIFLLQKQTKRVILSLVIGVRIE
jgi:hypothetical protein